MTDRPPTSPGAPTTADAAEDRAMAAAPHEHEGPTLAGGRQDENPRDPRLAEARDGVVEACADWLTSAWEQPVLRALAADPTSSLDRAVHFGELRDSLRALQDEARPLAEAAFGSLLDGDGPSGDKAIAAGIDAGLLQLVGSIGGPLHDAGFDPQRGGLDRSQDGYRLRSMTKHDQVDDAVDRFTERQRSLAAEHAERVERYRELDRAEVARLWEATGTTS